MGYRCRTRIVSLKSGKLTFLLLEDQNLPAEIWVTLCCLRSGQLGHDVTLSGSKSVGGRLLWIGMFNADA